LQYCQHFITRLVSKGRNGCRWKCPK
jgi:hypothetical protein